MENGASSSAAPVTTSQTGGVAAAAVATRRQRIQQHMGAVTALFENELVAEYQMDANVEALHQLTACLEGGADVWSYPLSTANSGAPLQLPLPSEEVTTTCNGDRR